MEERDGGRGGSVMILNEVGMGGGGGGGSWAGTGGSLMILNGGRGGSLIILNEGGMEEMGQFNDFYMKGEYGGERRECGGGGGGGGGSLMILNEARMEGGG